jgi:hypothetical protein
MGWGWNPVNWVRNAAKEVGNAFQSVGGVLAKIDPGPAIGKAGADLDKGVREVIPGGWLMVAAIAVTVATMGTVNLENEALAAAAAAEASEAALAAGATAAEAAAAGQAAAAAASSAGAMGTAGVGLTSGAVDAALAPSALQSALSAAGTGALYGGGIGGTMAAIRGQDPIKGAIRGAFYGGLTGGALSGLESAGVPLELARAMTAVGTGALQGGDVSTILQNSALSTALGSVGDQANQYVNPVITNAGTGAIGSAIKGGDPVTGAISGATGSLIGQGINAGKNAFSSEIDEGVNAVKDAYNTAKVNLAGIGEMGTELAGKYLTSASGELSNKLSELLPSIEEQRAALLGQADTVKTNYDTTMSAQKELQAAIAEKYNPVYENVTGLQKTAQDLYDKISSTQSIYDTNKAAYESSNGTDTAAFKAANDAAAQLNSLIPQYNTAAQEFTAANTQLTELYNADIKPLVDTFQTAKTTLDGLVSDFSEGQKSFDKTVDTASSYVTGLTDISKGQLPKDYLAAELSMKAPTNQGFTDEEVAAIQQGQQDAVKAAGTGTQTASNNNVGYVSVTAPTEDLTDAEPIPIPDEPTEEENSDQSLTDQIINDQNLNEDNGASTTDTTGQSGYVGESGYSGVGESGYSGVGESGYSGVGESGYNGLGESGYGGESGYSGVGESGYGGESGYSGVGESGYSGMSGYSGTGSTATGSGSTSTGTGSTSTGSGGSTPSLPAMKAAVNGSKIVDLTPQLTKATPFKFANEPNFSNQTTNMAPQAPFDYTQQILNAAGGGSIADLKAQLTKHTPFQFADSPKFDTNVSQTVAQSPYDYTQQILNAAQGGLIHSYAAGSSVGQVEGVEVLRPQVVRGRRVGPFFQGAQLSPGYEQRHFAEGGNVPEGHNPSFFSEGGLNSLENTYVQGEGDGTSDSVAAMLADGEFVIPADVVSKLGNGSNKAGAGVLDQFLVSIREHAQDHDPKKLPPESKGPLAYLLDAKRKVG